MRLDERGCVLSALEYAEVHVGGYLDLPRWSSERVLFAVQWATASSCSRGSNLSASENQIAGRAPTEDEPASSLLASAATTTATCALTAAFSVAPYTRGWHDHNSFLAQVASRLSRSLSLSLSSHLRYQQPLVSAKSSCLRHQ